MLAMFAATLAGFSLKLRNVSPPCAIRLRTSFVECRPRSGRCRCEAHVSACTVFRGPTCPRRDNCVDIRASSTCLSHDVEPIAMGAATKSASGMKLPQHDVEPIMHDTPPPGLLRGACGLRQQISNPRIRSNHTSRDGGGGGDETLSRYLEYSPPCRSLDRRPECAPKLVERISQEHSWSTFRAPATNFHKSVARVPTNLDEVRPILVKFGPGQISFRFGQL